METFVPEASLQVSYQLSSVTSRDALEFAHAIAREQTVVYVAPHEVHRFSADSEQQLGLLCIVDRDRERPVQVDEAPEGTAR